MNHFLIPLMLHWLFVLSMAVDSIIIRYDIHFGVEISQENQNLDGLKFLIPLLEKGLAENQTDYATSFFVTIHVDSCDKKNVIRFSDLSLLDVAFDQIDAVRNCSRIKAPFDRNHSDNFGPRVKILLTQLAASTTQEFFTKAASSSENFVRDHKDDIKASLHKRPIFVVVSELGLNDSATKSSEPLRIALYRSSETVPRLEWKFNSSKPSINDWDELANRIRSAVTDYVKMCRYYLHDSGVCSFDADGRCGRWRDYRSKDDWKLSNVCLRRYEMAFPCSNETDEKGDATELCDRACRIQTSWSTCNSSKLDCGVVGYRWTIVGGGNQLLYGYCPNWTNPTIETCVEKCADTTLAIWQIVLLSLFAIVGLGALVCIICFCVTRNRPVPAIETKIAEPIDIETIDGISRHHKKENSKGKKPSIIVEIGSGSSSNGSGSLES